MFGIQSVLVGMLATTLLTFVSFLIGHFFHRATTGNSETIAGKIGTGYIVVFLLCSVLAFLFSIGALIIMLLQL